MSLITSISGIRGTLGGPAGENLTPTDIVRFTTAYAAWLKQRHSAASRPVVVVGRDARLSGDMVNRLVCGTLMGCGIDVIDIGLATTPTTEMAVTFARAQGGLILTASHNPKQWNALKLLKETGEFLSAAEGARLLALAQEPARDFAPVEALGTYRTHDYLQEHLAAVLQCPWVDVPAIRAARFKVAVDAVNSVGGVAVPALLEALGAECIPVHCTPTGHFAHNPEPLPAHLKDLSACVRESGAHLGVAVDPDVDRLALVCEDGQMFGEEYTLVACADYVLGEIRRREPQRALATVSNLSSSRALRDVTEAHGGSYAASAVGEVNVVARMQETGAVIGGEGNGGVILPQVHPGRDALVGIALFLSLLARKGGTVSALRAGYPPYFISKNRIDLCPGTNPDAILEQMKARYAHERVNTCDGLRIDYEASRSWVHLRKSNTEPILRVYAEAGSPANAEALACKIVAEIQELMK